MPDKTIQTLRDLRDAQLAAKKTAQLAQGDAEIAALDAWASACDAFHLGMSVHGSYVLDLLAQREAALEEVVEHFQVDTLDENMLASPGAIFDFTEAPEFSSWFRSRTKEEEAEPPVLSSDELFHECVRLGGEPASVAAWPDFTRRTFIRAWRVEEAR